MVLNALVAVEIHQVRRATAEIGDLTVGVALELHEPPRRGRLGNAAPQQRGEQVVVGEAGAAVLGLGREQYQRLARAAADLLRRDQEVGGDERRHDPGREPEMALDDLRHVRQHGERELVPQLGVAKGLAAAGEHQEAPLDEDPTPPRPVASDRMIDEDLRHDEKVVGPRLPVGGADDAHRHLAAEPAWWRAPHLAQHPGVAALGAQQSHVLVEQADPPAGPVELRREVQDARFRHGLRRPPLPHRVSA